MTQKDLWIFIATLISATFLMGSSFVAGKVLILSGIPALTLVAWRFIAAAFMLLPFALSNIDWNVAQIFPKGLGVGGWLIVFLIGLFQTSGALGIMFLSMKTISAPNAAILLFTNPFWVAILGAVFLHEKLSAKKIIGLLTGIIGVYLAIGVGAKINGDLGGQILGLISAFCWAIATTINKKFAPKMDTFILSFWQMFIGSIILLGFASGINEQFPQYVTLSQFLWFIFLIGPGSAISFSLWFIALKKGGATNASSYLFLAPLFAVVVSYVVLGTKLGALQAMGGALIGFAIWLINRPNKNVQV